ncbi:MAG: acyl-CoA dehydrogenase family protein, partial [Stagnimonas sp.]|nr:acyl-CoA dehydrogenase family protein [Stagnimonas sp.]
MSHNAELELFRDNVRKFLQTEIAPHYGEWEKSGIIPRDTWNKFGDNGLLCVDTPEEFGGIGAPFEFSCVVLEEVSRAGFGALGANLAVHSDIVAPYITHLGTPEQKAHYLPKLVTGEFVGAIAMTEPGAGSDLQGAKTSATLDGSGYLINGSKTFITNGQHADVVITFTKTDPAAKARGTTLFLVDTSSKGFARGRNLEKIGQHCGDTSELFYDNVRVPATAVLGAVGKGFGHLVDELARERLTLAVGAIGAADGMLAMTIDYVKNRKAFGTALSTFQNTRFEIAKMQTDVEINRAFVEKCAVAYANGKLDGAGAAMVKLAATEMQCRVADGCLQLFGGYGFMSEYPISRHFIDSRVQRIYGGTSE